MSREVEPIDTVHLSAMTYANGNTWWAYKSPSPLRCAVVHKDHWAPAAGMLRPGDVIFASYEAGGARFSHLLTVVSVDPHVIVQRQSW